MNIISYLKVEDEETDLPNNINLPIQTMDALDQLENTLDDSTKMKILGSLNLLSTLHVMELMFFVWSLCVASFTLLTFSCQIKYLVSIEGADF